MGAGGIENPGIVKNAELQLVIIRLGKKAYQAEETDLFEFLTAIFYPHSESFWDTMKKYIDFTQESSMESEVENMKGFGMAIFEDGIEVGMERGIERGMERGMERGRINTLYELASSGAVSIDIVAEKLNQKTGMIKEGNAWQLMQMQFCMQPCIDFLCPVCYDGQQHMMNRRIKRFVKLITKRFFWLDRKEDR